MFNQEDDVRQTEMVIMQDRPRTADKCPTEIDQSGTTSEKDKESTWRSVDPAGTTFREEINKNCLQLMQEGNGVPTRAVQEIDQGNDQRSSTGSPMTILARQAVLNKIERCKQTPIVTSAEENKHRS